MSENTHNEEYIHAEHAPGLLEKLHFLLNGGGLCDVVLIAGKNGQRVHGHRVILAACSPYFEGLFTGNMLESTAAEVTLSDDVHGDYLQPLVQFCYTGKIEICASTVDELVQTAARLQLDAVVGACSKFMERRLDPSNCLGVAALAELLSLSDLKQVADKYARRQFLQVSQQEEFLKLNIAQLKILIASDDLNAPTEETVFHSVMSWVRYEMDEEGGKRSKHTPALLALVRLSHLPVTFLTEQIWDICHEHSVCLPVLREALKEANVPISTRRSKPRKSMQSSLLAVWVDREQKVLHIVEYSPENDKWMDKTFLSSAVCDFGVAFFNNKVIVAGGLRNGNRSKTVKSINLDTMTLSKLPSMALERSEFGIAVLDGLLYVAGGVDDYDVINRVERYNPNGCKWSEVAPLSVARHNFGLAVLNSRLFAVGGEDDDTILSSTECYNPQTDKWTVLAYLNIARSGLSIASGNGYLYAVGGLDIENEHVKSIERYDMQTAKWTEICSLNIPGKYLKSVFLNDLFLVLSYHNKSSLLQEYDFVTETWTERATLEHDVYDLCVIR